MLSLAVYRSRGGSVKQYKFIHLFADALSGVDCRDKIIYVELSKFKDFHPKLLPITW